MTTSASPSFTVLAVERASESWKQSLRARARVNVADSVVVELEVLEGRSGIFIAYPSRKDRRGAAESWVPILELADREVERSVFAAVRKEYAALEERAKAAAAPPVTKPALPEPDPDLPF